MRFNLLNWALMHAVLVAAASLLSLVLYAWDKRQAARSGWRVPEKRLHLLSLLGGWPGALIGQRLFRHKTVKTRFRAVFWLTALAHVLGVGGLTYLIWFYA